MASVKTEDVLHTMDQISKKYPDFTPKNYFYRQLQTFRDIFGADYEFSDSHDNEEVDTDEKSDEEVAKRYYHTRSLDFDVVLVLQMKGHGATIDAERSKGKIKKSKQKRSIFDVRIDVANLFRKALSLLYCLKSGI